MHLPYFIHRSLTATSLGLLGVLACVQPAYAQSAAEKTTKAETVAETTAKIVTNADGLLMVGFDVLASFDFTPPTYDAMGADGQPAVKKGDAQIPGRIKELNARQVAVTGFMLPIKMEQGLVKEFLLVKDPMMCCYGVMPKINEWVVVRMTGKGVAPLMDVPISFEGKLLVGELYDNGYLTGLYLLEGEKQITQK